MDKAKVIELFGTQELVAAALGITQSAVGHWPAEVPEKHALTIKYELSNRDGTLKRSTIRMLAKRHQTSKGKPA